MDRAAPNTLEFAHDDAARRYSARLEGREVAYSEADPISTDRLLIKHTEVLDEFEGRGFGAALVRHMLEDARREGRSVIPVCPYAASYIKRHAELMEYVAESYRAVLERLR